MKKFLIFLMLVALSYGVNAQSAELKLTNHNLFCDVYVDVYAVCGGVSNGSACNIRFCTMVPAGTTITYADPSVIKALPGNFCTENVPFGFGALVSVLTGPSPDWAWTDAAFQYQCPDCGEGGRLKEVYTGACGVNCFMTGGLGWSATLCNPPATSASWTSPGNCFMSDVHIEFW